MSEARRFSVWFNKTRDAYRDANGHLWSTPDRALAEQCARNSWSVGAVAVPTDVMRAHLEPLLAGSLRGEQLNAPDLGVHEARGGA